MYLATWASLEVAGIPDFLYWATGIDLLGGARTAVIAFFIFPLLLELLLNQQHIGSLNDANAQLAGRVRELEARRGEIEQLNDELRRQISDRAAQIYAALALARQAGGAARELATGEVVQGRYRVERPLGAGGMGTVYEVTRLADGRRLALKLARELHGEALARLAREAQTASTVANPHVVTIVDVDVASSGFLYIVMELVDGEPLGAARGRAGDRTWALRVLAQIADGLAALHRAGVIHRDLKPGNVLLARGADGRPLVKITDFGIALPEGDSQPDVTRSLGPPTPSAPPAPPPTTVAEAPAAEVTGATAPSPAPPQLPSGPRGGTPPGAAGQARAHAGALTRTGFLPGTPSYIAPELADGRHHLSVAADIFSFGVIAHELLVGRRPFAEPPVLARLEGRPVPPPPALAGLCDGIEADVARLLDACLAFEPGARPTAERLAGTLAAVAAAAA
jgi:serine/threonine protein kinase